MSCGKRPVVKLWDKPKTIKVIKPSPYEQNEASVKAHWKNVIRSLEACYKDDKFWESQYDTVRELLGSVVFHRMTKIFNLPSEMKTYEPKEEVPQLPSEHFYRTRSSMEPRSRLAFSVIDFDPSIRDFQSDILPMEQSSHWSAISQQTSEDTKSKPPRKMSLSKSINVIKAASKSSKSVRKFASNISRQQSKKIKELSYKPPSVETPNTADDLQVHPSLVYREYENRAKNPHFDMLYCNKSETDMIKWNSKYRQKSFDVSASDEFNKKAEITTKKIAKEFFDWWVGLGNEEFKSEIRRPEDIEDLFQVWFDEHASRGLMLDPKILPCVFQSIANYVGVPKTSCPNQLKRQIRSDIHAETSPTHTKAFGTCLPHKLKHIPPQNNTKKIWHSVEIPEDLRSMSYVWEEIQHLTSTKAFHSWLKQRPHLPIPLFFKSLDVSGEKKQLFVVPSDYVVTEKSSTDVTQDLAFPISEFTLELRKELSKILNE